MSKLNYCGHLLTTMVLALGLTAGCGDDGSSVSSTNNSESSTGETGSSGSESSSSNGDGDGSPGDGDGTPGDGDGTPGDGDGTPGDGDGTPGDGDGTPGDGDGDGDGAPIGDPPVVEIWHPGDGEVRMVDVAIPWIGNATDTEDGDITANIVWTSSLDGQFGMGGMFDAALSTIGMHVITASVTDSDNNNATAMIMLTIQ